MGSTTAHRLVAHAGTGGTDEATTAVIVIFVSLAAILAVYFGVLRLCYGSYSLSTVVREYKERRRLEERYNAAYQRREEMSYHRDWAKSRGDFTEARRLESELVAVESELDAIDDKLGKMDVGEAKHRAQQDSMATPMEMDAPEAGGKGKAPAPTGKGSAVQPGAHPDQLSGAPWVEKFRPAGLTDLVAHEEIISILNRLIDTNQLPHLLFYGPPGTGKTSTILACAKQMYGAKYQAMTLELNASDERGIDVVRQQIKEFAGTKRLFSTGVKLVILDEADHLTNDAQFALRRVIEKYTKNTRFCLICNYVSKIIPALQSRCTRFRFAPLAPPHVENRIQHVAQRENLTLDEGAVKALVRLGQGDMRRVLNVMQATAMAYPDKIDEEAIYLSSGNPLPRDVDAIVKALNHDSFKQAFKFIWGMNTLKGYSLADILRDIMTVVVQVQYPNEALTHLYKELADIEYHLAAGASEKLQLGALVGAFCHAREMLSS